MVWILVTSLGLGAEVAVIVLLGRVASRRFEAEGAAVAAAAPAHHPEAPRLRMATGMPATEIRVPSQLGTRGLDAAVCACGARPGADLPGHAARSS